MVASSTTFMYCLQKEDVARFESYFYLRNELAERSNFNFTKKIRVLVFSWSTAIFTKGR